MAAAQIKMEDQANKGRNSAPKFYVCDKVWLNLKKLQTPQLKNKWAWVNAKYKVIKIISPHVVELDVPCKIWPRFHVKLIRRESEDLLSSQLIDESQKSPISVEKEDGWFHQEQVVERILRAERFRRGKSWVRRVLVKWIDFAELNWEDRLDLENFEASDKFEELCGKSYGVREWKGARQGVKKILMNGKSTN